MAKIQQGGWYVNDWRSENAGLYDAGGPFRPQH